MNELLGTAGLMTSDSGSAATGKGWFQKGLESGAPLRGPCKPRCGDLPCKVLVGTVLPTSFNTVFAVLVYLKTFYIFSNEVCVGSQ